MFSDRQFPYFATFREDISLLIAPVHYVISWPADLISYVKKNFSAKNVITSENSKLRSEQLLLQAKLQKLDYLEAENEKLRSLLGLKDRLQEKTKAAQLFTANSSSTNMEMLLDKGKKDGVYAGQPILDAYGIIGQVIAVGLVSSRVMLITDNKSAIPVINTRTGIQAIAIGTGTPNFLELLNLPETSDINQGDLLVTSGLGSKFPEGYPVGVVYQVQHLPGERFIKVTIIPKSKISSAKDILLLFIERPAIEKALPDGSQKVIIQAKKKKRK